MRYWLRQEGALRWREVTRDEYIAMERRVGFSAPDGKIATTSFNARGVEGTILEPRKD